LRTNSPNLRDRLRLADDRPSRSVYLSAIVFN
jgi:hypothetical protein